FYKSKKSVDFFLFIPLLQTHFLQQYLIAGRKMGSKANGDATLRKEGDGRPVGRPFLRYGTGS
ncbi:hypothetical protein, partial [uncultured Alistipes sp.]|uniref:hypothetical protein n=1 Tax=uncultured Alistipes sp. TaxID=538949 RepID=UPI0025984070